MVWSIVSRTRRRRLVDEATRSRTDPIAAIIAIASVITYNLVGLLDIHSTSVGLGLGGVEEVNPIMRAAMDNFGHGWISAKLFLQVVISAMVLWFPHRIVLAIFIAAIMFNAGVVWSNLEIAGLL
jgi:hypothetical protein